MRPIRICQLITELRLAGAERCVYELSRRLDKDRFDVQVVALRGGKVAGWLSQAGIKVTILAVRGKWDVVKLARLTDILRRERIDILHTHLFHADLAGRPAARLAGVRRLVHTVHVAEGRFRPWQFAYARLLSEHCDRIVCVSRSVRDYHARRSGLPLWRYTVIPNGIDAAAFARDADSRDQLRKRWGIDDTQVLVAFVGRLNHQKGIDTFVAAMSHLAACGNPQRLVIAGEGPGQAVVENFIAHGEGGRFSRFLGFVDDVRGVLSAADIFVMPSRWEGWPLGLAEAMAAGLPVVATAAVGIADIVRNGKAGILVELNDVVALAEAIERLAGDPQLRASLGQAGREQAARDFSIEANVAAHEKLYSQIAADIPQE